MTISGERGYSVHLTGALASLPFINFIADLSEF